MSKFIKIMVCVLSVVIMVSGLIMSISGIDDFCKITFSTPIDINDVDTSKFTENAIISGEVFYVIDNVASAYSTGIINDTKIYYYLVPIKAGVYIIVATGNTEEINIINDIYQQTYQYLNEEIEDTFTSLVINGKLVPIDDELEELLYLWCDTTNYFTDSEIANLDEFVLPYVLYTQDWSNIQVLTIVGLVITVLGIVGIVISVRVIKK